MKDSPEQRNHDTFAKSGVKHKDLRPKQPSRRTQRRRSQADHDELARQQEAYRAQFKRESTPGT